MMGIALASVMRYGASYASQALYLSEMRGARRWQVQTLHERL
jgi:hypothetical protein